MDGARWIFVVARILLGASFLTSDHGSGSPGELADFVRGEHSFAWYGAFLHAVVLPNAALFEHFVFAGEVAVGVALILGVATRLAAAGAIFLLLNYMLAKGSWPWQPGIDVSDIALASILIATSAGRTLGIDRFLHERFPLAPLW